MSGIVYPGGQWQPPIPSLAALPVDKSKTEPKPAYYKLQFGDDVTGFSYYVRTLTVVVGRNCERSQQVPPPAITSPSVPPIPPLDELDPSQLHSTSPPIPPFIDGHGILNTPPVADFPSPPIPPLSQALAEASAIHDHDVDFGDMMKVDTASAPSVEPEPVPVPTSAPVPATEDPAARIEMSGGEADLAKAEAESEAAAVEDPATERKDSAPIEEIQVATDNALAIAPPPLQQIDDIAVQPEPSVEEADYPIKAEPDTAPSLPMDIDIDLVPKSEYIIDFDAPPPPPTKSSAPVEHVDVDLGPLKSVSRNHAKIEYRHDLGQFCLEIYGRNGAWVDDRYYVKGSAVPLYQGSQIQIATRIFSFILPPSAEGSPAYSGYGDTQDMLDDVPWPYNLPPGEVKYAEFYGEPGPGPTSSATIAARVPPPFNAFAAADGYGLGIEGVDGKTWDDEWNSDSGSDDDDDSDDDDEDEDEGNGGEEEQEWDDEEDGVDPTAETGTKVKIKFKADRSRPGGVDEEGGESEHEGKERKNGKITGARRKGSIQESQADQEEAGPKGGKGASKKKKPKKEDETDPTTVEESAADQVDSGGPTTPAKTKKKKDETGGGGTGKKESKKKKAIAPAEIKPAPSATPPVVAPIPTLAAAMAQNPTPVPTPPPAQQITPKPLAPTPQPATAAAVAPRPVAPATAAPIPPHLQRPAAPTTPASPASSNAGMSRAGSVSASATGPPEPPKPFFLTELNETPGRPGHIIVNVPIPPSGAGPRPPPGPLIGLDGKPFIGPPPIKPTATFATIIHRALLYLPRGRGTLGEVCNWVAGEWEWFRLNIDAGWQNSIRHNLSLNKAFLKVPRIPEDDPESKGSVWIIDPEEGPLFEEKQRRDAMKSAGKEKNAEIKRERERQKIEERARKQREMALAEHAQAQAVVQNQNANRPVQPRPGGPVGIGAGGVAGGVGAGPGAGIGAGAGGGVGAAGGPAAALPPRPIARPQPATAISANAKGLLQPKAKITVSIQTLTPAHRSKSVISTTDAAGNPLPFTCDGNTLTLDQATFGHLTGDIIDKLTLLGAAGAVDVLSAWVINKNKNQAARAAQQAAQATATANAKPTAATMKANLTAPRAATNGTASSVSPNGQAPHLAPKAPAPKPSPSATPSTAKPAAAAGAGKGLPGPAPPGASLTKVIGMIAEVANAKGDVNTVGPNASALLRYIRVVGVDIDLRVAEKIWATGVVPPLPKKGGAATSTPAATKPAANGAAATNPNGNGAVVQNGTPAVSTPTAAPKQVAASATPAPAVPSPAAAAPVVGPPSSAVKRKMDEGTGPVGNDEAKRPKIEASGA